MMRVLMFTQPGCISCELMKVFLEAKEIAFEESDISADADAHHAMTETYGSYETPTLVVFCADPPEVIIGFDPERLDLLFDSDTPSNSVA